ncbi:MAG: putative nitrogen fixation protein NifT [Deltaproteobacteria bacterium]|nr:putative nitrogen fixation protein NifT [Deltaproteobacteria bacterium]
MKVMVRSVNGGLSVYIPKKDLEARIIATDPAYAFGGTVELEGGAKLFIDPMDVMPRLPLTVNAKKVE